MTQFALDRPIDPNTKSGSQLADDLSGTNKWQDSLLTNHAGTSRPSYADATNGGLIWIDFGAYPIVYEKLWTGTADIVIRTLDFSGPFVLDQISAWMATRNYPIGEYVIASDYNLYRGLVTPNIGNNPVSSPTQWKQQTGRLDTATDVLVADSADGANVSVAFDGSNANTDLINVTSVEDQNGSLELKMAAFALGNWDMSNPNPHTVTLTGMPIAEQIVSISIMIVNDAQTTVESLETAGSAGATPAGRWVYSESVPDITMAAHTGGHFDNTNYDSTTINRGWVYIVYYE